MIPDDNSIMNNLHSINRFLTELGDDHLANMNLITAKCGQMIGAATALYNRIDDGLLCSLGQWNTPNDFKAVDKPDGHICFDVIDKAVDEIYLVENLSETKYAETDPHVKKYNLQTYMGHLVRCNGKPVGSLCVVFQHHFKPSDFDRFVMDILAMALSREESMQELRKSHSRYHDLFEFFVGGILTGSQEGAITDSNQSFCTLSGYSRDQLTGKFIGDLLVSPEPLTDKSFRIDRDNKGDVVVTEREIIRADGSKIPVEMYSQMMPDYTYQTVFHDITERKKAEKALIQSEERLRMILSAIPVVVYTASADSDVDTEFVTGKVLQLTGFTEAEYLSEKHFWRERLHPDDRERVLQTFRNCNSDNEIIVEYRWLTAGGQYKWFLDKSYLKTNNDKPEFLGMILDLTERKQVLEEIRAQNEKLLQLNLEKDNFFSIIAHDLRSPFNGFLGLTYLLTEEINNMSQAELIEIASTLRKSATNMYALLENLLEWSRVQRGVIKFSPEPLVLLDLVARSIDPVVESARNKKINIRFDIPENISVNADPHMAETIIRNLVSNSVKFTYKGGLISIKAVQKPNDIVHVTVQDNGMGMNKSLHHKLFNINEVVKKPGTEGEPSSGLGLIICKEFIEKHNCLIWVETEEGKGTSVIFTLPVTVL